MENMRNWQSEYEQKILERNKKAAEPTAEQAVTDAAAQGAQKAMGGVGAQTAQSSAQQGDLMGTAGGAMMMSGNPYLMAGGLGLTVLSASEKNRRAEEEAQRTAYNERIKQRQMIMQQIAQQGIQ
jgi:hypothetical protein